MPTTSTTLHDRIGGTEAIAGVVDDFDVRVLADPQLAPFFEGVNMGRQRGRQTEFIAAALGGPEPWTGPAMSIVHAGRGIEGRHVLAVAGHLSEALADAGVPAGLVTEVIALVGTLEPQIVSGTPQPRTPTE